MGVRHWGGVAQGRLKYGQPMFLVSDVRGVAMVSGMIRYHLGLLGSKLFFRGQTQRYSLVPSLFRVPSGRSVDLSVVEKKAAMSWLSSVISVISDTFDPTGNDPLLREALAQHYGLKTSWLDILDHYQTAAWFAYDAKTPNFSHDLDYGLNDDGVGYIFLVATPEDESTKRCFWRDLRKKPSNWLRPHVQQAFALRLVDPTWFGGNLDGFVVSVMISPRSLLRQWSNYDVITRSHIYPGLGQDSGLYYWEKSIDRLKVAGIPLVPPQLAP